LHNIINESIKTDLSVLYNFVLINLDICMNEGVSMSYDYIETIKHASVD